MESNAIIAAIDAEIARLQQARALLADAETTTATRAKGAPAAPKRAAKRVLSPKARKRIAEGQRKRWAAARQKTSSELAAKKAAGSKKAAVGKKAAAPGKRAAAPKKKAAAPKKAVKKAPAKKGANGGSEKPAMAQAQE